MVTRQLFLSSFSDSRRLCQSGATERAFGCPGCALQTFDLLIAYKVNCLVRPRGRDAYLWPNPQPSCCVSQHGWKWSSRMADISPKEYRLLFSLFAEFVCTVHPTVDKLYLIMHNAPLVFLCYSGADSGPRNKRLLTLLRNRAVFGNLWISESRRKAVSTTSINRRSPLSCGVLACRHMTGTETYCAWGQDSLLCGLLRTIPVLFQESLIWFARKL